jgi:hypothetical protein
VHGLHGTPRKLSVDVREQFRSSLEVLVNHSALQRFPIYLQDDKIATPSKNTIRGRQDLMRIRRVDESLALERAGNVLALGGSRIGFLFRGDVKELHTFW